MPSRSAKAPKGKIVALFDIGTSVVSGALVLLPTDKTERPIILHTAHAPIAVQDAFDFKRFFQIVLVALETAATTLAGKRDVVPEKIFCFLSSPWYASQTRTIDFSRPKPFLFTKKFAMELIERDFKAFEGTYLKNYSAIGSPVDVIEDKIIQIRLNGYKTPSPFGKRTKELTMHLFFSMSSHALVTSLEHALHRSFAIVPVSFHSFAFASFVVAREIITDTPDFLLVDVAGEMTDISIVKDGVLAESISFPSGKNAIIRAISAAFASNAAESLSLAKMHEAGKLAPRAAARVERVIVKAYAEWSRRFQESLFQLSNHASIPRTVALSADDDLADAFARAIGREAFSQYLRTPGGFNAILLEYDLLRKFCKVSDSADRDAFLMIESLFASKLL